MSFWTIVGRDPDTKTIVGWRFRSSIVTRRGGATIYCSSSAADAGVVTAKRRWPHLDWGRDQYQHASRDQRAGQEVPPPGPVKKMVFQREEVEALLLREREACARKCEEEERLRSFAGKQHPEDSEGRARCFAGARAAINCALAIRSEMPPPLEGI